MRKAGFAVVLLCLALLGTAYGDGGDSLERAKRLDALSRLRTHYEQMLRDAHTEAAAGYFLERLADLERQRRDLEQAAADEQAPGPPAPGDGVLPAPILQRAQAWLRDTIRQRLAQADAPLAEVMAWTRRELPDALLLHVAPPGDGDAAARWAARPRAGWLEASYGSGTYIVRPSARKPRPTPAPPPQGEPRTPHSAHPQGPKPLTRDGWWKAAPVAERTAWVLAFFVENSGLFEVDEVTAPPPCDPCGGLGWIQRGVSKDVPLYFPCLRCAGIGHDALLRYR